MFRFLYIILLSLFFTSCSVKSNLIQDEFTNIKKQNTSITSKNEENTKQSKITLYFSIKSISRNCSSDLCIRGCFF
mgnify:CR=1 FL=1